MKKILISGIINMETSLAVRNFPVEYCPIDYNFFGIETNVSGVGYNVATALKTLGAEPHILSIIGKDVYHNVIVNELKAKEIDCSLIDAMESTPQSVVLYDELGKRKIYADLKNIQDMDYPEDSVQNILSNVGLAVMCNVNFSRGLLKLVKQKGICIATDVHVVGDSEDTYNKDFMKYSDILFLSNENIAGNEREFLAELIEKYSNRIIVIGMGAEGALMYEREQNTISFHAARRTREIINTVGAGDALFSSFIFFYNKTKNPQLSIENAIYFASYKIGEKGAASGFLTEQGLEQIKNLY